MATRIIKKNDSGRIITCVYQVLYTELIAAATTQNITLDTLPAGAQVLKAFYENDTVFTSGSITGLTLQIGTSADTDGLITAGELLSGSPTAGAIRCVDGVGVSTAGAAILARFTASGANLGDASATALTAGRVFVTISYIDYKGV